MMVNSATIPRIPLDKWANSFVDYMIDSFSGVFTGINQIMTSLISSLEWVLTASPPLVTVIVFVLLALWLTDWKIAVFTCFGLLLIISLNLWEASMLTLSLVLASTIISLLFGVPLGILSHRFNKVGAVIKPILDIMQTMPAFVYLIPSVLLFGLGNVTALIATFIFAMPPAVRLTLLGLQQVPQTTLEAAEAFGATEWQKLIKVQLAARFAYDYVGCKPGYYAISFDGCYFFNGRCRGLGCRGIKKHQYVGCRLRIYRRDCSCHYCRYFRSSDAPFYSKKKRYSIK
ncbi:glycine betaine/proline transport system permease protein [Priestia megaterium]